MHFVLLFLVHSFTPDAFVRVRRTARQQISISGDAVPLDDYMRLPTRQYTAIELPMRAQLSLASTVWPERSGPSQFALRVPPLTFAIPGSPITVSPLVFATVETHTGCVLISSSECTLSGSPFIESLNDRFDFSVKLRMTWDSSADSSARGGSISADTHLDVDVDTPPVFALVPRPLLEAIASGATSLVLDSLQRVFLKNLAADYTRWATDAAYRRARAESLSASA